MFCERCKKNEATIHLSEIVKDVKSEIHLCEQCAREVGLNTKMSNFTLTLPEMLTFLNVEEVNEYQGKKRCSTCGCDFIEYKTNGKLGCPDCYNTLSDQLEPALVTFHGETRHCGKFPLYSNNIEHEIKSALEKNHNTDELQRLQNDLEEAVKDERYEDAAVIRDRIRELTGSLKK
ncbi:MAG TPA: UvrB/UvrC motif-containing protein [Spirochaetota bacterium]|nr:UvrB/UvrC motif-containing protein [Spirochaetota bacterium]HPJ34202.1 UvrB/UvrC motif-containing protein [Spirochaetota bacterium]